MKKICILAAAALFCVATQASAQGGKGVDKEGLLKKIERTDEDIANPKKNTKATTWIHRGDVFTEAGAAVSKNIFKNIEEAALKDANGNPMEVTTERIGQDEYAVYIYPDVKVYLNADGKVMFWVPLTTVEQGAFDKAYDAYAKAYEVDNKSASRVKEGILNLANEYKKVGDNLFSQRQFEQTADNFAKAFDIQMHPAVNQVDTAILYNAGLFYTFANDFTKAEQYLEKALSYGFEADGDVYFYLYHAYYGQNKSDKAMDILQRGIRKYPANASIIEGLVTLYSNTEGVDPSEIVPMVLKAIDEEPNNYLLWSGLGGVYDKLGQFDKAIEAYQKSVDIAPDDFVNNYRLGYAYVVHGDEMNKKLNDGSITNSKDYNAGLEAVNNEFEKALPWLEKAHQIRPNHVATVTLLKNITFRLRERPGIQEKNDHYKKLLEQMGE